MVGDDCFAASATRFDFTGNSNEAPQGRGDLFTDEIGGIVQAAHPRFILRGEPGRPYDHQQHTTIGNTLFDCLAEVAARFDACDIHKYFLLAEVSNQVVKQSTSLSLRIIPSIADEDCAQISTP